VVTARPDDGRIRILVVDDEPYLTDLIGSALSYQGYAVTTAGSARAARGSVVRFPPDLIILDVRLPDGSGVDVCRTLREQGCAAPVVFLTARDATEDRIAGLRAGGDDYVTKPFSIEELMLRVGAVLRRTRGEDLSPPDVLGFADLVIDESRYEVRRGGTLIDLTPTEYKLLRFFVVNAERVLTKRQILEHVWEYDFRGNDGVVQTYISYLRRKVDSSGQRLLHTVPRVGYIMRLPREI
jgi:two-component system OmpR family response regulator